MANPDTGEDGAGNEPWKSVSGNQLRANTVVFPALKSVKPSEYVHALEDHGINCPDILSVQVSAKGQCLVTFAKPDIADAIALRGFSLGKETISPRHFAERTIQLHIHDVPVWVSDGYVTSALAQYGSVAGPLRHGKFKSRAGTPIANGTRFATFKPKPNVQIPSNVSTPDGKSMFRVYYEGQVPTCFQCKSPGHIAKDCDQFSRAHVHAAPPNPLPAPARITAGAAGQQPVGPARTQASTGTELTSSTNVNHNDQQQEEREASERRGSGHARRPEFVSACAAVPADVRVDCADKRAGLHRTGTTQAQSQNERQQSEESERSRSRSEQQEKISTDTTTTCDTIPSSTTPVKCQGNEKEEAIDLQLATSASESSLFTAQGTPALADSEPEDPSNNQDEASSAVLRTIRLLNDISTPVPRNRSATEESDEHPPDDEASPWIDVIGPRKKRHSPSSTDTTPKDQSATSHKRSRRKKRS